MTVKTGNVTNASGFFRQKKGPEKLVKILDSYTYKTVIRDCGSRDCRLPDRAHKTDGLL